MRGSVQENSKDKRRDCLRGGWTRRVGEGVGWKEVLYKTEAWLSPPTAPAESPPDLIMSRFDDTCLTGEVHGHSHTLGAALPFLAHILRNSQAGRSLITPIQYTYSLPGREGLQL